MGSDILPVIPAVLVFMIPIIAILAAHQRKMAEIMHRNHAAQAQPQSMDLLTHEVRQLKEAINHQTLALDNLMSEVRNNSQAALGDRLQPRA